MKNISKIKNTFISITAIATLLMGCTSTISTIKYPNNVKIKGLAQNPEGIEFNKNDHTFFLSSLNAAPIAKVNLNGTFKPFTSGEKFPLSTAGLQIDYKRNRLLVAGFNGTAVMDNDPKTKGVSFLRIYDLTTGVLQKEINLSSLAPDANSYFANDVAVDSDGNVYISDWYANLIYKVDLDAKASIFWKNSSDVAGEPNGLDFHPDGYLLVSLISVNEKGIYSKHGLVKIPVDDATLATNVTINDTKFAGFDGMVITSKGNIIGVTNDRTSGGGNLLIELLGTKDWSFAEVINAKAVTPSTTVAVTPDNENYVINQDFSDNFKKSWTIEKIKF